MPATRAAVCPISIPSATLFLVACFSTGVLAGKAGEPVAEPRASAPDAALFTEEVRVIATRLPGEPDPLVQVPAHVTVIDRERIEASGARTLQDLLALEAGVVLYDQVGNDIEKTTDLRGFTDGSSTRVYLDGAPINDIENNGLALELVPLSALARVEIFRGSAAASSGGSAQAGVIHLLTRRGEAFGGSLSLAAGTFGSSRYSGDVGGTRGRFDYFVSAESDDTDGFRQNAGGDVQRAAGHLGLDLGGERRLELSVVDGKTDLGNPGALTEAEWEQDPFAAPFNSLDFSKRRLRQTTLNFRSPIGEHLSLGANLFVRDRTNESLSTGRSASLFGGFFLDSDASALGSTVQLDHDHRSATTENRLALGLEWLDGNEDSAGYSTSRADPGSVDLASPPSSLNTTERRTLAVFVQDRWRPVPRWNLSAGLRYDRDRVELNDVLDPTIDDARDYAEVSFRAGTTWEATRRLALFASYGEGFRPPSSEELFAFPLFGSNRDLRAEDSRSYEAGLRARWQGRADLGLTLYRIDTSDEIVFVVFPPDPPPPLFGLNVNAGAARRQGVELAFRGNPTDAVSVVVNATLTDAELTRGSNAGRMIPLVPRERLAVALRFELPAKLSFALEGLHVGEQVLDSDESNAGRKLEAYVVVDARLARSIPLGDRDRSLRLFVETRNLLDERYATRGIFVGEAFYTPAPGRRHLVGAEWRF